MATEDLILILILATYFGMLAIERLWPAREFPPVPWWTAIGVALLVLMLAVGTVLPLYLPVEWLAAHRLFDLSGLGVVLGVLIGYPVVALVNALYHRLVHAVPVLWRWTHQLHHSAVRVDIPGSALFHPTDMVAFTVLPLGVSVFVLGLAPAAAAWVGYITLFYGLFQHWNVRTPQWLGYLIQRPESHCVHHRRNFHSFNYSDFPLWDILMGTFRNPPRFEGDAGFGSGADRRYGAMFIGRDVNPELDAGGGGSIARGGK
jgi:sterol desaturase/sphingolipid hydroxylase (fatty acid hydroxylase superfamily)